MFQHELDHLNGKLMMEHNLIEGYIDKKSDLSRIIPRAKAEVIVRENSFIYKLLSIE